MHNACGRKAAKAAPTARAALDEAVQSREEPDIDPEWIAAAEAERLRIAVRDSRVSRAALFEEADFLRQTLSIRYPHGAGDDLVYVRSTCVIANALAFGRRASEAEVIEAVRPEERARLSRLREFHRRRTHPDSLTLIPLERPQYEGFRHFLSTLRAGEYLGFLYARDEGWHLDRRDCA